MKHGAQLPGLTFLNAVLWHMMGRQGVVESAHSEAVLVLVLVLLRYLSLTGIGSRNYGAGSNVRINSMTLDGLENAMCIRV